MRNVKLQVVWVEPGRSSTCNQLKRANKGYDLICIELEEKQCQTFRQLHVVGSLLLFLVRVRGRLALSLYADGNVTALQISGEINYRTVLRVCIFSICDGDPWNLSQ